MNCCLEGEVAVLKYLKYAVVREQLMRCPTLQCSAILCLEAAFVKLQLYVKFVSVIKTRQASATMPNSNMGRDTLNVRSD